MIDSVYTNQLLYAYGFMSSLAPPWITWNSEQGKNFLHQLKDWEDKNPSVDDTEMSVKGVIRLLKSYQT